MHLIYTRFFSKAMREMGIVGFDEPMVMLRNQGIILAEDGFRMSKSRCNVVAPDEFVQKYGADTVRGNLMFGWRWEQGGPWDSQGIEGVSRWLQRLWSVVLEAGEGADEAGEKDVADLRRWIHKTIRRVTQDMESFSFNTIIAALMEFTNALQKAKATPVYGTEAWGEAMETLLLLLAPCCPHVAEELWRRLGHEESIAYQPWPEADPRHLVADTVTLAVR